MKTHQGSCHCGAVRFEAEVDPDTASRCNCSICTKVPTTNAIVKPASFRLLTDEAALGSYAFATRTGTRFFCKTCGTHCFGRGFVEELGGEFVSISVNALDDVDPNRVKVVHWDGRHDNWQAGPRPLPWPIFAEA